MKKVLDALSAINDSELNRTPWSSNVQKKVDTFLREMNNVFNSEELIKKINENPDPDKQLQIFIDTFNPYVENKHSAISQSALNKLDLISQNIHPNNPGHQDFIRILQLNTALYSSVGSSIKKNVNDYKQHLEKKLTSHFGSDFETRLGDSNSHPSIIQKLISRYQKIKELDIELSVKQDLDSNDMTKARDAVTHCTNSKPSWSERPFLQKLTDVLSLGMKPLYRAFTSKEKSFSDELDKTAIQSSEHVYGPKK